MVKKRNQNRKRIFPALAESFENHYKSFLKTLWIFNYNRFPSFILLLIGLIWPIHWGKEEMIPLILEFIAWYFVFNIFSSVLFLNDCLKRRSLYIIAKLDKHITLGLFREVFLILWVDCICTTFLWYAHITCFCNIQKRCHYYGYRSSLLRSM